MVVYLGWDYLSKMKVLHHSLIVLASFLLCREGKAMHSGSAWHEAIQAYETATEHCKGITRDTSTMIKSAANLLCREAFKALDTAVLNTCPGWQNHNPKCRQVSGATEPYHQCTIASRETFQPPKTLFDCAYTTFQQVILSIQTRREWLSSRRTSMVRQASGASGSGHPGASSSGHPGASSSGHPGASSSGHPGARGSGFVTTGSGRGSPPRAELISLPSTPQFNPANKDPSLIDDPEYRVEDFSATPAPRGTIEFLPPHRSPPRYSGAGDTGSPPAIRTSPLRPELVSLPTTPQFNPANKNPSLIDDPGYRVEDFSGILERACIPPPRSQPQSPPRFPPRSQPQSDLRYPPGFPPHSQPQSQTRSPPRSSPGSPPGSQPQSDPRYPPRSQPRSPPHFAARGKGPASASGSGCASPPRPEQIFLPPTPPFNPAYMDPSLIEDPDFGVDDISCVDPDSRGKAPYVSPRRSPQSPRTRAGSPVSHPVFSGGAFTGFEFSLPPTPEEPSGPVDSALLMDEDFSVADFEPAKNQPDALAAPSPSTSPPRSPKLYTCDLCGRIYPGMMSLVHHRRSHRPKLKCPHCTRTFSLRGNLDKHVTHCHSDQANP